MNDSLARTRTKERSSKALTGLGGGKGSGSDELGESEMYGES